MHAALRQSDLQPVNFSLKQARNLCSADFVGRITSTLVYALYLTSVEQLGADRRKSERSRKRRCLVRVTRRSRVATHLFAMHGLHGDKANFEAGTAVACRVNMSLQLEVNVSLMGNFDQDIPFMCTAI